MSWLAAQRCSTRRSCSGSSRRPPVACGAVDCGFPSSYVERGSSRDGLAKASSPPDRLLCQAPSGKHQFSSKHLRRPLEQTPRRPKHRPSLADAGRTSAKTRPNSSPDAGRLRTVSSRSPRLVEVAQKLSLDRAKSCKVRRKLDFGRSRSILASPNPSPPREQHTRLCFDARRWRDASGAGKAPLPRSRG